MAEDTGAVPQNADWWMVDNEEERAISEVETILGELGLAKFAKDFQAQGIETREVLARLERRDLEKLGLGVGHIRMLQLKVSNEERDARSHSKATRPWDYLGWVGLLTYFLNLLWAPWMELSATKQQVAFLQTQEIEWSLREASLRQDIADLKEQLLEPGSGLVWQFNGLQDVSGNSTQQAALRRAQDRLLSIDLPTFSTLTSPTLPSCTLDKLAPPRPLPLLRPLSAQPFGAELPAPVPLPKLLPELGATAPIQTLESHQAGLERQTPLEKGSLNSQDPPVTRESNTSIAGEPVEEEEEEAEASSYFSRGCIILKNFLLLLISEGNASFKRCVLMYIGFSSVRDVFSNDIVGSLICEVLIRVGPVLVDVLNWTADWMILVVGLLFALPRLVRWAAA